MTKLSIITICYNEPDVEKTCESIVNQTWQDFEWIVVDGGSGEETQKIFDKYKHRMNKFISEPDNGIYNAYNKGLKLAEGEYLHFLNAGDYYFDNNVLQKVFSKDYGSKDIIHGDVYFYDSNSPKECKVYKSNYKKITPEFFISKIVFLPAAFIRKDLFKELNFTFNENYKIVSDLEMWIVFAFNNAIFEYLPLTVSVFNTEGISSNPKYKELHQRERKDVFQKYFSDKKYKKILEYGDEKLSQKIFSIKKDKITPHKVITVCGVRIKIRRKIKE